MRKYLYKFFDKFSLVDIVLIAMIVGLGFFSWSKYQDGLELTKRLALQKLFIGSDVELKSMQEWLGYRVEDAQKIATLYAKDTNLSKEKLVALKLDGAVENVEILDSATKKELFVLDSNKSIKKVISQKVQTVTLQNFYKEGDLVYVTLAYPLTKDSNLSNTLYLKINATYIAQLFHTQKAYRSYMFNRDYELVLEARKMPTSLVVAFEKDKRIDQHIFEHIGYDEKEVLGVYTPFELYGYKLSVINEALKESIFAKNYETREKILIVLMATLFFSAYLLMYLYKKRLRESRKKTQEYQVDEKVTNKEQNLTQEQEESSVEESAVLWDREAFKKQYKDMEDMMETIISLFKEDTPVQLENLQAAIEQEDYKKIKHFAHTIKGSASNLSAVEVVKQAKNLEKLSLEKSSIEQINKDFKEFMKCCFDTIDLMDSSFSKEIQNDIELSNKEKKEQLLVIQKNLENAVYMESASFSIFKLSDNSLKELKYAIDSFDTQKALLLIQQILEKEE